MKRTGEDVIVRTMEERTLDKRTLVEVGIIDTALERARFLHHIYIPRLSFFRTHNSTTAPHGTMRPSQATPLVRGGLRGPCENHLLGRRGQLPVSKCIIGCECSSAVRVSIKPADAPYRRRAVVWFLKIAGIAKCKRYPAALLYRKAR